MGTLRIGLTLLLLTEGILCKRHFNQYDEKFEIVEDSYRPPYQNQEGYPYQNKRRDEVIRERKRDFENRENLRPYGQRENRVSSYQEREERKMQEAKDQRKAEEARNRYLAEKARQNSELARAPNEPPQSQQQYADDSNTWRFNVNVPEVLDAIKTYTGLSIRGNGSNVLDRPRTGLRSGGPAGDPWSKTYTVEVKPDFDKVLGYFKNMLNGRRNNAETPTTVDPPKAENPTTEDPPDAENPTTEDSGSSENSTTEESHSEESPTKEDSLNEENHTTEDSLSEEYPTTEDSLKSFNFFMDRTYVEEGPTYIKSYKVIYPTGYYSGKIHHLLKLKKKREEREKQK